MRLVVDANVLFSALIKDSISSELIFSKGLELYTPQIILEELAKHLGYLKGKTQRSDIEFNRLIESFKTAVSVISNKELSSFVEGADIISPDPNDILYFAVAIMLGAPIWSNDKALKKQDRIKIYTTAELLKELGL